MYLPTDLVKEIASYVKYEQLSDLTLTIGLRNGSFIVKKVNNYYTCKHDDIALDFNSITINGTLIFNSTESLIAFIRLIDNSSNHIKRLYNIKNNDTILLSFYDLKDALTSVIIMFDGLVGTI